MGGSSHKTKPEKAKAKPAPAKKPAGAVKKIAPKATPMPAKPLANKKPVVLKTQAPPAIKSKPAPAKAVQAKPVDPKAKGKLENKTANKVLPAKPEIKVPEKPSAAKGLTPKAPVKGVEAAKKGNSKAAAKGPETIAVDPNIKRPSRPIFIEVKPGAERVIKRGDKSLAAPAPLDIQSRRKGTTADETPEELVERIERELEHQFFAKRNALKPQMCTKCGINVVTERFTIDRELGYCKDCAEILRLGETKEARRMEFNPSVAKPEGAAKPTPEAGGDEDEAVGEGPVPDIE